MTKPLPPFRDIAWCSNAMPGHWHECDDSPMSLDLARSLRTHSGHVFAQRRDNEAGKTFLVWKRARFFVGQS